MSTLSSIQPCQRTVVVVDIERSTASNNTAKAWLRNDMYGLFERAMRDSGITEDLRERFDRGDGVMALVHPTDQVPKTRLLDTFVPSLRDQLEAHNVRRELGLRLRVAIHSGDVHFDEFGAFGVDIDITVRLLDHLELKARLRRTAAPMVLVVSEQIHRSVLRHDYDGIDAANFEPLIQVEVANQTYLGWVYVPGEAEGDIAS